CWRYSRLAYSAWRKTCNHTSRAAIMTTQTIKIPIKVTNRNLGMGAESACLGFRLMPWLDPACGMGLSATHKPRSRCVLVYRFEGNTGTVTDASTGELGSASIITGAETTC